MLRKVESSDAREVLWDLLMTTLLQLYHGKGILKIDQGLAPLWTSIASLFTTHRTYAIAVASHCFKKTPRNRQQTVITGSVLGKHKSPKRAYFAIFEKFLHGKILKPDHHPNLNTLH